MMKDIWIKVRRDEFKFNILDGDICHTDAGWDFWTGDFPGVFEPATINWMREYLDKDHDFLDIGAWVGPTAVYATKLARHVYAFEPDKVAFTYLIMNLANNAQNATAYNEAIATVSEVQMYSRTYPGDSMSNMLGAGIPTDTVKGCSLEAAINMGNPSLIKMDVEGGEALILPANKELLRERKIPLILSFHNQFYTNPDDFSNIVDAISVYDKFYDVNGNSIGVSQIPPGFDVILCL